jgi:hypothetical protein
MSLLQCGIPSRMLAIVCAILLAPGDGLLYAQKGPAQDPAGNANHDRSLTPEQLNSLVAPIALYPDPLLAQILAASTYPLQIVEANRWLQANSKLKGKKLVDEAAKQDWDPSVQALVVFPKVLQQMDQNLPWTTSLGNAFLAQQEQVMAAIQQMRQKAYSAGNFKSNSQQKVEIQTVEGQSVITVQAANPQVIYVPTYNPTVVYGPPPVHYPYPAMVYPPAGAVVGASAISFGVGVALGAAFSGCCGYSGWGWGCNWGPRGSVTINNNFFSRYGFATPYGAGAYGTGTWAHNPYYRGAVPYSSAAVAGRYGRVGGAVATPYGGAAGARGLNGAARAIATSRGGAAGVRTPNGAAGAAAGPNRAGAGVRTSSRSAGFISTPSGNAARVKTPKGSGIKTPSGTYRTSPYGSADRSARSPQSGGAASTRNFGSGSSAFSGAAGNGDRERANSDRGFSSMGGGGRAAGGSGGGRQGGGGRRR